MKKGGASSKYAAMESPKDNQMSLRVGVVGCGQVARHHLGFIAKTKNAKLVGLADSDQPIAESLGRISGLENIHGSLAGLLDSTPIDVLHVLTPPKYHYDQALTAVSRRVHVLVEKPLTLNPIDTEELYGHASDEGVSICPDFIQLFNPLFQKAASVINSGELGRVLHVVSCMSLAANRAELQRSTGLHWSFSLPGGVLQNYLTHPLYLVLYWLGNPVKVNVSPRSFGTLPQRLTDHLEMMLEGDQCTGSIIVSFALQRDCYYVEIFCEQGTILVDFFTSTFVIQRGSALPRFADRALSNLRLAWQLARSSLSGALDFVRGKLVPYQGLQVLIPAFYSSIVSGMNPPVAAELAIAVSRTEFEVFSRAGKVHLDVSHRPSRQLQVGQKGKVLVTGASGYIGSEVTRRLVDEGYGVRALVRPLSRTELLEEKGVELVYGDIVDSAALHKAMQGMDTVVHLAAPLKGEPEWLLRCIVEGTRNVAAAARSGGVKRVVYMSSMAVYDYAKLRDGDVITEETPLEEQPEKRGAYSLAKREAETIALSHLGDESPSWTIVRPSLVVGKGGNIFSPAGLRIGRLLIAFSAPSKSLRLIHVEDVAAAISQIIRHSATVGRIYTISSGEEVTLRDYVNLYIRAQYSGIRIVYVPYWLSALLGRVSLILRKITGIGPAITIHRLAYLYRDVRVSINSMVEDLGWRPRQELLADLSREVKSRRIS